MLGNDLKSQFVPDPSVSASFSAMETVVPKLFAQLQKDPSDQEDFVH